MVIIALKTFDIVYVMTGGQLRHEGHRATDVPGDVHDRPRRDRASAIAVILLLAIIPVMFFNIRRFRAQEAIR